MALGPGRYAGVVRDVASTTAQRGFPSRRASGIGGTGFVPTHLPGCELWLDAADTDTITSSSGAVSQWNDKSGFGRNFTQATGASQPTTGTVTQNGLNVIDFDGSADYLDGGNIITDGTFGGTIAVVAKLDTATGTRGMAGKSRAAADPGRFTIVFDSTSGYFNGLWDEEVGAAVQNATYDPGAGSRTTAAAWVAVARRPGWNVLLYRNATLVATSSATPTTGGTFSHGANNWYVGAYQTSAGSAPLASTYLDGWVAEVCCWARALTVSEAAQLNNYLMGKWAL